MTLLDHFTPAGEVKIDPKNRLPLGGQIKKEGVGSAASKMLTIGFDGCLYLMPEPDWDALQSKLSEHGKTDMRAIRFQRTILYYASKVKPDSQWRIVVPERLMSLAGFTNENRDACLLWMNDRLEIWEKCRFGAYMRDEQYALDPAVVALRKAAEELTL
jgi:MraZ protein